VGLRGDLMAICKYCKKEKPDDGLIMCESCRERTRINERNRKERIKNGEPTRHYGKTIKPINKKNVNARLDEKIRNLNEYNEKHGTRLTYGKYMGLVLMGKV
jgi:RecJ-like exonuclease